MASSRWRKTKVKRERKFFCSTSRLVPIFFMCAQRCIRNLIEKIHFIILMQIRSGVFICVYACLRTLLLWILFIHVAVFYMHLRRKVHKKRWLCWYQRGVSFCLYRHTIWFIISMIPIINYKKLEWSITRANLSRVFVTLNNMICVDNGNKGGKSACIICNDSFLNNGASGKKIYEECLNDTP